MTRGVLRVYLGAAPGVGKTFAMLDEGHRRRDRGADVVIGVVETHGRVKTQAQLGDLEVVPRRRLEHRGTWFDELDLTGIIDRRPDVVLVDELAHTNAPGSVNEKRWQDVEQLLDAGIEVISTLNIQHLESVKDVVQTVTGTLQRESVPDAVVRRADQIELVDMSPEALRRRMAHGNIYPPERVPAALDNYFRPGNLGALRELALLWVADRVDDALVDYKARHGITTTWETRERIVVAVTGATGSDQLIRRAARIAGRARGQLVGVHVTSGDGLRANDTRQLERHRDLVVQLGGVYREVAGDDVAQTLVSFARSEGATQLVLGASGRSRRSELLRGSVIADTIREAGGMDVHVIAGGERGRLPSLPTRLRFGGLPWRRQVGAWALLVLALPLLTVVLATNRADLSLATDLLLYLLVIVAAGAVGGVLPALTGAVAGSLLANFYLVEPTHTFTIGEAQNLFALVVFVVVAGTVSAFVTLATRRSFDAKRARGEAEALARATATLAGAPDPMPMLLDHLRTTFSLDGASVLRREASGDGWMVEAGSGQAPTTPEGHTSIPLGAADGSLLVLAGGALSADDRRVLRAYADQLAAALSARALHQEAARTRLAEDGDALRTALLQSVSHDLRAPLANIKAAVTSLLSSEVDWDQATTREFLQSVDGETDRLNRLVGNLLDMSRLQAGALNLHLGPVALEDVVATALASLTAPTALDEKAVVVDLPVSVPLVQADPDLLERAVANVLSNAARFSPAGEPVHVDAAVDGAGLVHLRVADYGPGIDDEVREWVLRPFQRLGDHTNGTGVGLGLAVATGFVRVMGGTLSLGDTAGRGLTVDIALPAAPGDAGHGAGGSS